jgi:hypothetical protein
MENGLMTWEAARTNPECRELLERMDQEMVGQVNRCNSKALQNHNLRKSTVLPEDPPE